jgi:hypothetical protein
MKARTILLLSAASLLLFAGFTSAKPPSTPAFDALKTLVGEWEGKAEGGAIYRASYKVVSAGSALMETLTTPDGSEMITMYHPDGGRVVMTHYCTQGNQPRMHTGPLAGPATEFNFSFVDATNLASPAAGHMRALVVTLKDKDHFTQKWTFRENGQEHTEVFHFTRKK